MNQAKHYISKELYPPTHPSPFFSKSPAEKFEKKRSINNIHLWCYCVLPYSTFVVLLCVALLYS